jgi:4'-phosphopantetheinyl transferase EntD
MDFFLDFAAALVRAEQLANDSSARVPAPNHTTMPADVVFRIDLPHGRCVGVEVPSAIQVSDLRPIPEQERAFLMSLPPARRPSWLAGRIALHAALKDIGLDEGPVLATTRGAPDLPSSVTASISHKRTLAVALAAPKTGGLSVGIDIEPVPAQPASPGEPTWNGRPDISSLVMTERELGALVGLPAPRRRREVVLHFSVKEALYKALNPIVGRYVSFHEATVLPASDGSVGVTLGLAKNEGPFRVEAHWSEIAGHLLTTAALRPAG